MDVSDQMQVVHRPLRRCLTGLAIAGAGLAAAAATLTFIDCNVRDGTVYLVAAAGLTLVGVGLARSVRWIVALTLIACAGQLAAVIGTVLELIYGVAPFKATQLRTLGFDPNVGVGINLVYSTVAFGLFCWFGRRWWRRRRCRPRRS